MDLTDVKVYGFNAVSLMITMTEVEDTLKIILLIASIGYTAQRWYIMNKNQEE